MAKEDRGSIVDTVLEAVEPYRNGIVMVGLVAVLLTAFQLPDLRPGVARGLVFGVGPLLALLAWTRARDASAALSLSWLALSAMISGAAAYAAQHGIEEGEPTAVLALTPEGSGELVLPSDGRTFRLRVTGDLEGGRRESARAAYQLHLERGDADLRLRGELYRDVRQESQRGGAPTRTVSLHRSQHHDASMPGRGPVTISVGEVEDLDGSFEVALFTPFGYELWWRGLMAGLFLLAVFLEVLSARAHTWTPLSFVAGFTLVLGNYVALRYDVDQPLITFLGGTVFSLVVGGLGGLCVGLGTVWVLGKLFGARAA
ncbi:MAG: hypothetical protein JRH11_27845 [Deltaproteobacteria bacterium]|nr:hypothetical protein [Deltaproteobacteria bacterium]